MSKNNKVEPLEGESFFELADKMNSFFINKDIICSPIFPPQSKKDTWKSMVYFYPAPLDIGIKNGESQSKEAQEQPTEAPSRPKSPNEATDKQIKYLKDLGYSGEIDNLTRGEAKALIQEMLKNKKT